MVVASLLRRRSRMLIALLSIGIGATILSGLVTVYYDVPRQMGAQFRGYGANMILLPSEGGRLDMDKAREALAAIPEGRLVGATPYRYVRLDMVRRQQSFTAAGTDFDQLQKTSPYFRVDGRYPSGNREVLVGKKAAELVGVRVGSVMELSYKPADSARGADEPAHAQAGTQLFGSAEGWNGGLVYVRLRLDSQGRIANLTVDASTQTAEIGGVCEEEAFTGQFIGKALPLAQEDIPDAVSGATMTSAAVGAAINAARTDSGDQWEKTLKFTVIGILDTGGEEENYLFLSMSDMDTLTASGGRLDVVELSISASAEELESFLTGIRNRTDGLTARLIKRVTKSETAVLSKLQTLVFLVTAIVLVLTMICVSTTMMAVVAERRREIGLRKALGASDGSIRTGFLGEGLFLGLLGGILGALLGFAFAQVVSIHVFAGSIMFRPLLVPVTAAVSMLVAALSCLIPIRRAVQVDPALVLKGE